METLLAPLVGLFLAVAIYFLLSRSLIRMVIGLVVLGNGVNLLLFVAGRLTRRVPPLVPEGAYTLDPPFANPLPQALILTAIVISFALFTYLLTLTFRAYQEVDADNTDSMRVAEPEGGPTPPLSY